MATPRFVGRFFSDYGIVLVLLGLCAVFSAATLKRQSPDGEDGGRQLADIVAAQTPAGAKVIVVARPTDDDRRFAEAARAGIAASGRTVVAVVHGQPPEVRAALEAEAGPVDAVAAHPEVANKAVLADVATKYPRLGNPRVLVPGSYYWPTFLKLNNLLNIANQIAVIAIIAIGMTLVIVSGGIDLSVGSLMSLSAVAATLVIRDVFGAYSAGPQGMVLGGMAGLATCGLVGFATGTLVAWFRMPAFIVTLSVMLIGIGSSFTASGSQSVYQLPAAFTQLGTGKAVLNIPNSIIVMLALYAVMHFVLSRTVYGRYLYAVGGNAEAARLSGVPVRAVVMSVYVVSGLFAGLGGVITASQFASADPNYGKDYELYAIAAAVVGGASLSGGEGKLIGTLFGALLIAVIQNGMNLTGIGSHPQKIVLGGVILLAVLLDRLKKHGRAIFESGER